MNRSLRWLPTLATALVLQACGHQANPPAAVQGAPQQPQQPTIAEQYGWPLGRESGDPEMQPVDAGARRTVARPGSMNVGPDGDPSRMR
jgi:hypothetical protein